MTRTTVNMSISLDGYIAGPDQSEENPIGIGGTDLHQWHGFGGAASNSADQAATDALMRQRGAVVMGRNMYGPIRGEWGDTDWRGWWGDEPPYHSPVFVLTHHEHEPIEMEGGTTFHFVTTGFESAYEQACAISGPDGEVLVSGGASTVRQALLAGVVDEISLAINPVVMGSGERLFEGITGLDLEIANVIVSPNVTHVHYLVKH
jgi:dihydrofolate reductase